MLTIKQGQTGFSVWYYTEKANAYIYGYEWDSVDQRYDFSHPLWSWYDYSYGITIDGAIHLDNNDWYLPLYVHPGPADKLVTHLQDPWDYDGIRILDPYGEDNYSQYLPGSKYLGDNPGNDYEIVPFSRYDMGVGLLDKFGNPTIAREDQIIDVNLSSDNQIVEFFDCYNQKVQQVTMTPGYLWQEVRLVSYAENTSGSIYVDGLNLKGGGMNLNVIGKPAGVALYVTTRIDPSDWDYFFSENQYWWVDNAHIWNDTYTPCIVGLV